ncbi:MAG: hypothetical protein AAFX40_15965 [Cyanobacteria bacterium J06639_1]
MNSVKDFWNALRAIALAIAVAFSLIAAPAQAMGSASDTKSVDPLPEVRQSAEEAIDGDLGSLDEVQARTSPTGLNSVQGTAGVEKLMPSEESESAGSAIGRQAGEALQDETEAS